MTEYGELTASKVKERALAGGNPEVGGACIKHHSKLLSRSANTNCAIVLGLYALVRRGKRGGRRRIESGRRKRGSVRRKRGGGRREGEWGRKRGERKQYWQSGDIDHSIFIDEITVISNTFLLVT